MSISALREAAREVSVHHSSIRISAGTFIDKEFDGAISNMGVIIPQSITVSNSIRRI
jgi:hypothetical protein